MRLLSRPHFPSCFLYWLTLETEELVHCGLLYAGSGQKIVKALHTGFEPMLILHDLHSVLELVG